MTKQEKELFYAFFLEKAEEVEKTFESLNQLSDAELTSMHQVIHFIFQLRRILSLINSGDPT